MPRAPALNRLIALDNLQEPPRSLYRPPVVEVRAAVLEVNAVEDPEAGAEGRSVGEDEDAVG